MWVRLLWLKSLRDVARNWPSFWAGSLMVAVAVTVFLAFASSSSNLDRSSQLTYERLKFMDLCLPLKGSGPSSADRVAALPGVAAAVGRRLKAANLLLADGDVVRGVFIGMPVKSRPAVNDVYVEQGRYLEQPRGEAMVEKRFALLHGLGPGDTIVARLNEGAPLRFRVVGLVSSPEYLWLADNRLDPRPSARRLGIVFLSQPDVCTLSGQEGISEINLRLERPQDQERVQREAEKLLRAELSDPPMTRAQQPSNALLVRDRQAFQGVSVLFPLVFLSLAGLTLWASLSQLVSTQRKQLGVLMSLGFSETAILLHYVLTSLLVAGVGALLGLLCGTLLGELSTRSYSESLGLPFVDFHFPWTEFGIVTVCVLAVAATAAWRSAGQFLRLEPAQALRAEFATQKRFSGLQSRVSTRLLPPLLRLPVRNLFRQPARSLTVVGGIGFANAVLIMSLAFFDGQRDTMDFLFHHVHTHDLQVNLRRAVSPAELAPIQSWPGVLRMELYLRHGATLSAHGREIQAEVWGIPVGAQLLRVFDDRRQELTLPLPGDSQRETLLLGPIHRRELGVQSGSELLFRVSTPQRKGPVHFLRAGPELFEPVLSPPKMALRQLQELVASGASLPGDGVNLALLKVDPDRLPSVRARLYASRLVRTVDDFRQLEEDVANLMRMVNAYFTLIFGFSAMLALALIAGTTTMNVFERKREIATMVILGVREGQLAAMIASETLLLWFAGLIVGAPLGYLLGNWLLNQYQNDLMQIALHPRLETLVATALSSLGLALLASINALRMAFAVPLSEATQGAE